MAITTLDISNADLVASEFLGALAQQDWPSVQSLLDRRVSFRVLTPRGLREANDDAGTIAWLTRWFGDADELVPLGLKASAMHDRLSMSYCFRIRKDRWYVIEQRGYADVVGGRITSLSLVCSGFRPA